MTPTAIFAAAGLAFVIALSPARAQAQNARSFVSSHGLDTNACTLTAPCRTFAVAFTHTNAGGEIDVLDPAGYGPLTINKAISIVNDGTFASVLAPPGGTGITINAGPSDSISLRGLAIQGAGVPGTLGIAFNSGGSLNVENCAIHGFFSGGIYFTPNSSSNLAVVNTAISDIATNWGILVYPTATGVTVNAAINRINMNNNASGISADGRGGTGSINVTVADSVLSNGGGGVSAIWAAGAATVNLMTVRSVIANNAVGIFANGASATVRVTQSTLTGNANSWETFASGIVLSYGDNNIDGNGDGDPGPSIINKK